MCVCVCVCVCMYVCVLRLYVDLCMYDITDLGMQASQRIMSSPDQETALKTLKDISQYLPVHTRSVIYICNDVYTCMCVS